MRIVLLEYLHELKSITVGKLLVVMSISISIPAITRFINQYIYSDWDFLIWLGVLISIDTCVGVANALCKHKFNPTLLTKVILKIALYSIALIVVHVLMNFRVNGSHPSAVNFIDDSILTAMMAREAVSIFVKITIIKPDFFPKWYLKRLEFFDENGKLLPEYE